jgi:preprotein translocase subunit YajC
VDQLGAFLPILLLAVLFYFLVLRPARGRQAAQRAVVARLEPGARVMTTAGLFGTVTAVDGDQIELEIAPGVQVRYVAAAVATVLDPEDANGTTDPDHTSDPAGDTPEA